MADLPALRGAARDLLDFEGADLYFDEPMAAAVARLLERAQNADPVVALAALHEAFERAPDDLTVIVALYRFHYFRHDFAATLTLAETAMAAAGRRLNIPADWRALDIGDVERAGAISMPLLRFYLWALKGEGYVLMRLGRFGEAVSVLEKLRLLDRVDRLGGEVLLALARDCLEGQRGTCGNERIGQ